MAAGTPVETEHGPRPIEQLRPGDRVWSFDTQADRLWLTAVEAVHRSETPAVYDITPTLSATAEHPIYASGRWVPAERL